MINDKQWFISGGVFYKSGWKNFKLSNGMILNYHEKLNVIVNSNCSAVILGYAWQVDKKREDVEVIISKWDKSTKEEEIIKAEETWCGRYVLIVGDYLYQDATSQMSTFYDMQSGKISSSINLLITLSGEKRILPKIRHGIGMNFLPGPNTMYLNIKKILASQIYNIRTGEIRERILLPNGVKEFSEEQLIEEFSMYFIHSLKEMRKYINGEIKVALTGGYDSRTLLSLIKKANIPFECYTFDTKTSKGADEEIPPLLCKYLGIKHQLIFGNRKLSKNKYNDYIEHSAGMARDGDLIHFAKCKYDILSGGKETIILYSGIWEVAVEFYREYIKTDIVNMKTISAAFPDVLLDDIKKEALNWWFTYIRNSNYPQSVSDLNRFYWEQRDGCWMSYISQAFDVMDNITMIQPCNCRLFLSYLLGFDKKDRIQKQHQVQIINYNIPELKNFPYADSYPKKKISVMEKIRNKCEKYIQIVNMYGIHQTIKYILVVKSKRDKIKGRFK